MKKKILGILICGICLLGLTGCGGNNTNTNTNKNTDTDKKTINYKDLNYSTLTVYNKNTKETEYLTLNEITKLNESNSAKFKQNYEYSNIKVVGKIYKIKSDTYYSTLVGLGKLDLLYLGENAFEGLLVILPTGQYNLADLSTGDLVYVESGILYSDYENKLTLGGIENFDLTTEGLKNTKIEVINDKSNEEIDEMLK